MLQMAQPRPLVCLFCDFQAQILQKKNGGFSGIQTPIVGLEGEHADTLTTTTTQGLNLFHITHCL